MAQPHSSVFSATTITSVPGQQNALTGSWSWKKGVIPIVAIIGFIVAIIGFGFQGFMYLDIKIDGFRIELNGRIDTVHLDPGDQMGNLEDMTIQFIQESL